MLYLKQSTASQARLIGPFVDDTDGATAETGLTIANTDIRLSANGGNMFAKTSGGGTHDENGWYTVTFDATDTATVGALQVSCKVAGALAVWAEAYVLEEAIYDALFAASAAGFDGSGQVTAASLGTPTDTDIATDIANVAAQVSAMSASSSALVATATDDNANGTDPLNGVTYIGSATGTRANLDSADGTYFSIDDTGNAFDCVVEYTIPANAIALAVEIDGYLNSGNDEENIQVYDHDAPGWVTRSVWAGKNGSTNDPTFTVPLGESRWSSSAGIVYIRHVCTGQTNPSLNMDRMVVSYVNVTVGHSMGAYWVDSAGTSGQVVGTNGVADSPCPWADAIAMNAVRPMNRFHIANGNTVTLAASGAALTLFGEAWNLVLNGKVIDGMSVDGAAVTDVGTAVTTRPMFCNCKFGAATIPPAVIDHCGIGLSSGTFTAGSAGDYDMHDCYSLVPGSGSPTMTFTGLGAATTVGNRGWFGGLTFNSDSDVTLTHEVTAGGGVTLSSGGGDCEIRGTTRSLAITLGTGGSETIQFVGTTGPITVTGAATAATVNLHGVSTSLGDTSSGSTVTDNTIKGSSLEAVQADLDILTGTDGATLATAQGNYAPATVAALSTAQTDLDTITGTDGVTLATAQGNYAPATAASMATAQADLDTITGTDGVTLATTQGNYAPATAAAMATAQADLDTITGTDGVTLATTQGNYAPATATAMAAAQTDLDTITDTGVTAVALTSAAITDVWSTDALTELYNAQGAEGTPAQLMYLILSAVTEFDISGTVMTCKELDGSTPAATYTLNSATSPTNRTRAT